MQKLKWWYIVYMVFWTLIILPGVVFGFLLSGGEFTLRGQSLEAKLVFFLIWILFLVPVFIFPFARKG